jgi:sulfide:quinone oxidoreductase
MAAKTILILGGGVGGLIAVNELRRRLPQEHRIVLVEKNALHTFAPSFLWLMTGERVVEQITRPVRHLVRPGVEVIQAEVRDIDLSRRFVQADTRRLTYDYLIISLGAELAPEVIPGLAEGAHTFYTLDGTVKLRDALRVFDGGRVAVVVSALPYKCPGAPPEGAMLIADLFTRRRLRDKVDLHLFTPEPQPMPVAGPLLGGAVRQMLETKGVTFHPLHKLTAVDPQSRELFFEGKEPVRYDLLVAVPPHRGPHLIRQAGLANEAGWIPVDRATLITQHENVYALGDVTVIPIPGRWKAEVPLMLPKAGVFAHAQAEVVAHRIATEIAGAGARETFCGDGYCMLEAGGGLAGFAFGNFFAEPSPEVRLRKIGRAWHVGKVLFEQWWLAPFGLRRETLRLALKLGGKALGIPIVI